MLFLSSTTVNGRRWLRDRFALPPEQGRERRMPRSIWWDIYPTIPKAIRLGEVEAADKADAIAKAAEKFEQDPANLIAVQ